MFVIKKIAVTVIIVLSTVLFPITVRTVYELNSSVADAIITDGAFKNLAMQISTPNAGLYFFPPELQKGIRFLQEQRLDSFRLSPAINRDAAIQQSLTVGAYPIHVLEKSDYYVMLSNEQVPSGCAVVSRTEEVVLAHCP
jgi:hypothetical protein